MGRRNDAFAHIFRDAVARSGLTLAQIVKKLEAEGLSISPASLSYWQSGKSVPRRQSSAKTLMKLEEILSLQPGTLLEATVNTAFDDEPEIAETFENTSRGMIVPNDFHTFPEDTDSVQADWASEVERKVMRVTVKVSDSGRSVVVTNVCIVALRSVDNPVFHVGNVWNEGDSLPELYDVIGGQVAERFIYHDEHYVLRTIRLPKGFEPGELRQVGWTYRSETADRVTRTPHRWFAQPLETYSLTLEFSDVVPRRVEWVQVQLSYVNGFTQRVETSRELKLNGNVARLALENIRDCTAYLRWEW